MNRILRPFEYTKVDDIIELIFETQKETEKTITGEDEDFDDEIDVARRKHKFTLVANVVEKRQEIAKSFFGNRGINFKKISIRNFISEDENIGICCVVSKRYERKYQPYWYALHPKSIEFMEQHKESYYVLCCMDRDEAFFIPFDLVRENIENLNISRRHGGQYWHVTLSMDEGKIEWNISKIGKKIDLSIYALNI